MLQHHHTSHCPFERYTPPKSPPIPTNWTLTTTTRPPPTLPLPFPSLPLFHYSLSPLIVRCHTCLHGNRSGIGCCSCDLSGSGVGRTFFFLSPTASSLMHSCTFSKHAGCVRLGHMISVVRGFGAKFKLEATCLCEKMNRKKGAGREGCLSVCVCSRSVAAWSMHVRWHCPVTVASHKLYSEAPLSSSRLFPRMFGQTRS